MDTRQKIDRKIIVVMIALAIILVSSIVVIVSILRKPVLSFFFNGEASKDPLQMLFFYMLFDLLIGMGYTIILFLVVVHLIIKSKKNARKKQ